MSLLLRNLGKLFSQLTLQNPAPARCLASAASLIPPARPSLLSRGVLSASPRQLQPVRHLYYVRIRGERHDGLIHDPVLEVLNAAGPPPPRKKRRHPLDSKPFMKGVVIKTLVKKPKKPNSANRKCVLVRLSNGKEATAYIPGVGHNLQEHSVVLVYRARTKDVPGLKLKVVRGKYDCAHVIRKPQSGS
ncbi:unnamed protein product [Ixodes persulcatus]